jgi:pimeloyl-ACP methyl ester carboxylesterase
MNMNTNSKNTRTDYWRTYHDEKTLHRADTLRKTVHIESTGVRLHIDVYEQADKSAPVFLFNHGGGGYSRLFIPIALALYDLGYTVVLPDQRGQGLSGGKRGDYTLMQLVHNIVDAACWAREHYTGHIFMGGGSFGGGLTYYAAVAGAPVEAMVLHNLYDYGNIVDGLALSRLARLAQIPGVSRLTRLLMSGLKAVLPSLQVPYGWLGAFETMVDERAVGFYTQWKADPVPVRRIAVRFLHSTMSTPPTIAFEHNTVPALVINPARDQMVSPAVTRRNYERLGGPKQYFEMDYGHWAMGKQFVDEWAGVVHRFLRQYVRVS